MKTADKKRTAETLKEKPVKIKVGWLDFKIKPLTLMQIYEMSVFANDIKKPTWKDNDKVNIIGETIAHGNDARLMCEIFVVCAFRNTWKRCLWRRYIRKHLNIIAFNELVKFISQSFNANFFLTSITFLTQAIVMTEPQTTPHGQSSEL
jgi:hypothetical protein